MSKHTHPLWRLKNIPVRKDGLPLQFPPKNCVHCDDLFIPRSGSALYCSKSECQKAAITKWRATYNEKRRIQRQKIQTLWGYLDEKHGPFAGRKAEEYAMSILPNHGFSEVSSLSYLPFGVFDFGRMKKTA